MKKLYITLGCIGMACLVQGQTYPSSVDAANSVEAPASSSLDLLKRSLAGSSVQNTAAQADTASVKRTPKTASNTTPSAASSVQTPSANAAASAPAAATPAATPAQTKSVKTNKGALLEMPLSSGEVVKAQVPVTKQVSPAAAKATPAPKTAAKPTATSQLQPTPVTEDIPTAEPPVSNPDEAAQAELDYAARMLRQAKEDSQAERFIPQPASRSTAEAPVVTKAKSYDPTEYRPGVEWIPSNSTHFVIYTQKRDGGIGSSNMGMIFESAYATLRRNIPWMMSNKVRVFIYQDHNNYLQHEPNAKAWTRALAYPTRGEIVVYDEPGKQQELKEVFTHELVHIFTQQFFDKYKTGRLMTPTWLDEGLAVYMEDQAYNGLKGGPWGNDLKTLNFQRSQQTQVASFGSKSMFGEGPKTFGSIAKKKGKPLYFMPFDQFMEEGSLDYMESRHKTQDWYFQAYAMVRFLLNPAGGTSPSNRMQFEQFTRLIAQGEQVRDPNTGFPAKDSSGKPVYQPYSLEKALGRVYHYNNIANFEDQFWRWANNQH